jgi:hypothetical protein
MAKLKLTEKMTHEERLEAITKWEADNEKERRAIIENHIENINKIHKEHQDAMQNMNIVINDIRKIIADIAATDRQIKENQENKEE